MMYIEISPFYEESTILKAPLSDFETRQRAAKVTSKFSKPLRSDFETCVEIFDSFSRIMYHFQDCTRHVCDSGNLVAISSFSKSLQNIRTFEIHLNLRKTLVPSFETNM